MPNKRLEMLYELVTKFVYPGYGSTVSDITSRTQQPITLLMSAGVLRKEVSIIVEKEWHKVGLCSITRSAFTPVRLDNK